MTDNPFGMWGVALGDQVRAAIENNDWPAVARMLVDGYLTAVHGEWGEEDLPLAFFIGSIHHLHPDNMELWLGEALRQLYEQRYK